MSAVRLQDQLFGAIHEWQWEPGGSDGPISPVAMAAQMLPTLVDLLRWGRVPSKDLVLTLTSEPVNAEKCPSDTGDSRHG